MSCLLLRDGEILAILINTISTIFSTGGDAGASSVIHEIIPESV